MRGVKAGLCAGVVAAVLSGIAPAATAQAAGSDAMQLIRELNRQDGIRISWLADESPTTTVRYAPCHENRELGGGCVKALHSKDAALFVFDTAENARAYAGNADDVATALGKVVVSFGSPARVGEDRRPAYVAAARAYRSTHPRHRNEVRPLAGAVMNAQLPMRGAWVERDTTRAGLGANFPGVVDLAASKQVDVMVFDTVANAKEYAGHADDQRYRVGRYVLSYGNPALLGPARQAEYNAAFREVLGR